MFRFTRRARSEVEAEGFITPLEAAADPVVWREIFRSDHVPPRPSIKRYVRTDFAPHAALFSAQAGARTLIVGFCGKKLRLLMPVAMMLQSLDDNSYDALILADPLHLHFDKGINGFAESMLALARRIETIMRERGYTSVITYGTSMGGFPALRMGDLIRANRSISCGGRPVGHMERLGHGKPSVGAFDLICNCRVPLRTTPYVLYSLGKEADASAARLISKTVPDIRLGAIPHDAHNFPFHMYLKGNLDEFFRQIFDLEEEPDLARVASLLD